MKLVKFANINFKNINYKNYLIYDDVYVEIPFSNVVLYGVELDEPLNKPTQIEINNKILKCFNTADIAFFFELYIINNKYYILYAPEIKKTNKKYIINFAFCRRSYYLIPSEKATNYYDKKFFFDLKRNDKFLFNLIHDANYNKLFRILKIETKCVKHIKLTENLYEVEDFFIKKQYGKEFSYYIVYDIETCANQNFVHVPYLICAHLFAINDLDFLEYDSYELFSLEPVFFNLDTTNICAYYFGVWLEEICLELYSNGNRDLYICLFGFNNYSFDDNFCLNELLLQTLDNNNKKWSITIQSRNKHFFHCEFVHILTNITIVIKDLIIWFPGTSLLTATQDLIEKKLNFDVLQFNIDFIIKNNYCINVTQKIVEPRKELKPYFKGISFMQLKQLDKYKGLTFYDVLIEYCKQDVKSTKQLFLEMQQSFSFIIGKFINEFKINKIPAFFLNYISPASLSGILINELLFLNYKKIHVLDDLLFEQISNTYYGGRVCNALFGDYLSLKNIAYYDVRSMYSLVMKGKFPYLESHGDCLLNFDLSSLQNLINNNNGEVFENSFFILCDILMPENENNMIYMGPLPERIDDNRINFPNKNFYNRYLNSAQISCCRLFNYKIIVKKYQYNILFLKNDYIFKKYVDFFIKFKIDAQGSCTKDLIKLMLNSPYGKMAQKESNRIKSVNHSEKMLKFNSESNNNSLKIYASLITSYASLILLTAMKELDINNINNNIPIKQRCSILYCDTDSIIFDTNNTNPNFIHNAIISYDLGHYDELIKKYIPTWSTKYSTANRFFCLGKKAYQIFENDRNLLIRLKGLHSKYNNKVTLDVCKKILNGNDFKFEFTGLIKKPINMDLTPYDYVYEDIIKKTISINNYSYLKHFEYELSDFENNKSLNLNKNNLLKTFYKKIDNIDIYNNLFFINY